jgi:hypothetical protein
MGWLGKLVDGPVGKVVGSAATFVKDGGLQKLGINSGSSGSGGGGGGGGDSGGNGMVLIVSVIGILVTLVLIFKRK